jgi:hypothetical protein
MEHKLIQGGEIYLPFARSRIKALRATGLEYAAQKFLLPDGEVHIRIAGEHDYIRTSGGGSGDMEITLQSPLQGIPGAGAYNFPTYTFKTWTFRLDKIDPMNAAKAKFVNKTIERWMRSGTYQDFGSPYFRDDYTEYKTGIARKQPYKGSRVRSFNFDGKTGFSSTVRVGPNTIDESQATITYSSEIAWDNKFISVDGQSFSTSYEGVGAPIFTYSESGLKLSSFYPAYGVIDQPVFPATTAVRTLYFFADLPSDSTPSLRKVVMQEPYTIELASPAEIPDQVPTGAGGYYTARNLGATQFGPDFMVFSNVLKSRYGVNLPQATQSLPANRLYSIVGNLAVPIGSAVGGADENTLQLKLNSTNLERGAKFKFSELERIKDDAEFMSVVNEVPQDGQVLHGLYDVFGDGHSYWKKLGAVSPIYGTAPIIFIRFYFDISDAVDGTTSWSPGPPA